MIKILRFILMIIWLGLSAMSSVAAYYYKANNIEDISYMLFVGALVFLAFSLFVLRGLVKEK